MPTGNLSHSMRDNYNTHGVSEYYKLVQESYRNPHFLGLKKVLAQFLDRYVAQEKPKRIRVLDLAAGSGEATIVINDWYDSRWPSASPATSTSPSPSLPPAASSTPTPPPALPHIRQPPTSTAPPSLPHIRQPFIPPSRSAAPSPARPAFRPPPRAAPAVPKPELSITAADPFTAPAYKQRTGLPCLEMSFADVAAGQLPPPPSSSGEGEEGEEGEEEGVYDLVVISFALHLVESSSELWALLNELAKRAKWLVVTAPHKKPDIKSTWGWRRWDPSPAWSPAGDRASSVGGAEGDGFEIVLERVRLRVWRSEEHWAGEE
ncbi:hypothetical protein JCM8097_007844 [Rhodosporidiobolus ruineniae]